MVSTISAKGQTPTGDLMALAGSLKSGVPYLPKEQMKKIVQEERVKRYAKKRAGD